ncbi:hypothetical protein CATYP_00520 [Corynebacterium atypicum]|uniref:tRNA adenosine deaminase n=1 Tax=Corynebacterium atypicum TaxID=191610 RepID=A0ABN4DE17_9CORY|nr:hypothetical protein CATYP_00520 [Corynebacterium atypicum]
MDDQGEDEFFANFAVTVTLVDGQWLVHEFADDFTGLDASLRAVRALRSEGPAFALLCVDDDYFLIVRPSPTRTRLLLSDATAAVDDDIAADALDELGIEVPDLSDDELEETDPWPEGDFDILADLGLAEQVMEIIADDPESWASEQIVRIAEELDFVDELYGAVDIPNR